MASTKEAVKVSGTTRHVPVSYAITTNTPVVCLDAKKAFNNLTERERLYAHYLSRASFYGGLIVLVQTSPESPAIFRIIHRVNLGQTVDELRAEVVGKDGVTEEDFLAYLAYCSGIYTNMGNYKGFGDSKIVPDVEPDKFESILKNSKAWRDDPDAMHELWTLVKSAVFGLDDRQKQLGLGSKGITTYFTPNCDQDDADLVNKFLKERDMEGYINRVLKRKKAGGVEGVYEYEIRHAASSPATGSKSESYEGHDWVVTYGDYEGLLERVNCNLRRAIDFCANDNEKRMLEEYAKSFERGSLDAHKDGSRFWIANKGPVVETYIGFIETYRDPAGMRGEFEGFVAMVNKEQSTKFQELVEKAEQFLELLVWPKEFEKDKFLRPDFTSLDVLTFAGSGVPAGINIPNYDEIRQSEGFKNVNLGNVISSSYKSETRNPFVTLEDHELLERLRVRSFEVQVGLHELLGHGSGKLLRRDDGVANFTEGLINPVTGKPVDKVYEKGETYDSKFTSLGSSYEECRAECVGLYLSINDEVLNIFGVVDPKEKEDVVYVNWLSLCHAAIRGVEMFSPASSEWKQAHSQARFVILQVLLAAGEGFVSVKPATGEDGKPDLLLTMDRSKLVSVGKPAIGEFLKKLQVYKSTGDFEEAKKMYDVYSNVDETWAKWRDIVVARKQPRKMLVQANTVLKGDALNLVEYSPSHEGMMQSWRERFSTEEATEIDGILDRIYKKDAQHWPL